MTPQSQRLLNSQLNSQTKSHQNPVWFYDRQPILASFSEEVLAGLRRQPRRIPPKFFYDEQGSQIFDAICDTEEYYVTRTEIGILNKHRQEIASFIGPDSLLIEPGSGSSRKVRILLDTLRPQAYLPMDISGDYLKIAAQDLADDYPWLNVHAACIDYTAPIDLSFIPGDTIDSPRKVAFFPGSSIGNFEPSQALQFLKNIAAMVRPAHNNQAGGLLIGVDLKKDPAILNAAYNDDAGITAAFNLNLLNRINEELNADFTLEAFSHQAFYNDSIGRIEMHLVSQQPQTVNIHQESFHFEADESIHTENSYKYHIEEFQALARLAGFEPLSCWTDDNGLFSVHFLETIPAE